MPPPSFPLYKKKAIGVVSISIKILKFENWNFQSDLKFSMGGALIIMDTTNLNVIWLQLQTSGLVQ